MTNIPATLHSAALAYAAEQLEATGERGTLDAIVLLGQLAAAAPRPLDPNALQLIPVVRHEPSTLDLKFESPPCKPHAGFRVERRVLSRPIDPVVAEASKAGRAGPYACGDCLDGHRVWSYKRETWEMCTRCPTPCQTCRAGGTGPYCAATPCGCACHAKPAPDREWGCDLTFAGGDGMLLDSVRAVDVRSALEQFCRHPRYLEAVRVMVAEIA